MATNYKIRLKRFNGTDYDTLNLVSDNIIMSSGNNLQTDYNNLDDAIDDIVYVGASTPTDPDVKIWLDTDASGASAVNSVNGKAGTVVLDADDVGATPEWTLVWTNASPSSDFAAQTINIDLSQYSEIMVTASTNANNLYANDYIMMIDGLNKIMEQLINVEAIDGVQVISRVVTPTESSVTFANAYDKPVTQNTGTVKNIRLRPLYIYAR